VLDGSIRVNGNDIRTLTMRSLREAIGVVPQSTSLFNDTIRYNLLYGRQEASDEELRQAAEDSQLLEFIESLEQGWETVVGDRGLKLSGGEKQRVALARALAPSPGILLLDEPLSSMDPQTAKYLRLEVKRIQQSIGVTTIYVTHDLHEAEELADRIAIMFNGRIEQVGLPREIFFCPVNERVSRYIGAPNIMECEAEQNLGHGLIEVVCSGMRIVMPKEGDEVRRIAFLPRDIYVSPFRPPGPEVNRFRGVISDIKVLSEVVRLCINVASNKVWAELPLRTFEAMGLEKGMEVYLIIRLRGIRADYDRLEKSF